MALSKGKPPPAKRQMVKLSSRMDQQGVIQCNSRLDYVESKPYDKRCPIAQVTKLIERYYHILETTSQELTYCLPKLAKNIGLWRLENKQENG